MNTQINIPNKSHFKLNEVCGITGVKPYVLRFWESEFEELGSIQSSSGQKIYAYEDVETIFKVKELLFDQKLTIEQARLNMQKMMERQGLPAIPEVIKDEVSDVLETAVTETPEEVKAEAEEVIELSFEEVKEDYLLATSKQLEVLLAKIDGSLKKFERLH